VWARVGEGESDMESIEGRVALVTGGGRGIGRAIALALARAGASVAVAARTVPEIEAVAAEVKTLGRRTFFFPLDVSDRAQVAHAPRAVAGALGPVDILVNSAGILGLAPVQDTDDATWDAILAVDLTAPFLLTRAFLPGMYERHWGRVINVASASAELGANGASAYVAATQGLVGFTRSLAIEAARKGVTANAICPAWTETRMMDEVVGNLAARSGRTEADARSRLLERSPLGRAALPEEVGDVAALLARSPLITGQAVHLGTTR
jgi:meso-butanediol dehydrogenase/(S,S)-butanediol dehydrogenase/diacetyl reductase